MSKKIEQRNQKYRNTDYEQSKGNHIQSSFQSKWGEYTSKSSCNCRHNKNDYRKNNYKYPTSQYSNFSNNF